jgi:anti-sigma factor RsiW
MNPCDNTILQSELKAYLDGQLPFVLRQRVRRHLKRCAACREELSAMEQISNELHADGPKPLESSLRDRILSAVSNTASQAAAPERPKLSGRWRRKPLLIWGGAATALVAWFTLYPLFQGGREMSRSAADQASSTLMAKRAVPSFSRDYDETVAKTPAPAGGPMVHTPSDSPAAGEPPVASGGSPGMAPERGRGFAGGAFASAAASSHGEMKKRAQQSSPILIVKGGMKAKQEADLNGNLNALTDDEKVERQVHRGATITVQVDNVEARSEQAAQCAQTAGGFVANNELSTGDDNTKTASLTLKVPVTQFEAVLSQVARMGEVKAKNVTGEDLTEKISDQEQAEHVLRQDIGTTQEELSQRLSRSARQERMDTLRELRTRIAQTGARLKLLRKLGALSDITLELNEKPRPAPAPKTGGFLSDMNDTLHGAVQSMMQAARLPILTFIWILAYSPLWLLLILGYRYAVRR